MTQATPAPVTLETAWRNLSVAMFKTNADKAKQSNIAVRGVMQLMGRR